MHLSLSSLSLIRYAVGYVFVISGMLKLLTPSMSGVFAEIGMPSPEAAVLIIALTEVVCGFLIVLNLFVKQAIVPLIIIMIGALLLVKVPYLHAGFFHFAFEARLDIVMLLLLAVIWKNKIV